MARKRKKPLIEDLSIKATNWIGTPQSIIIHTIFFIGIFVLSLFGVAVDTILLVLTTAVSLEAIYLAIFIQMTVNKNTLSLAEIEEDVDDLEDDIEELQENDEEDEVHDKKTIKTLTKIEDNLQHLLNEIDTLKNRTS